MKYAWIEAHRDLFSVSRMCRQFEVSRSGYCQWRTREPSERSRANEKLDVQVAAIHRASGRSYGRERIHQVHYPTRAQARLDIVDWIEGFYNRERLHSSVDYRTPIAAEHRLMAA